MQDAEGLTDLDDTAPLTAHMLLHVNNGELAPSYITPFAWGAHASAEHDAVISVGPDFVGPSRNGGTQKGGIRLMAPSPLSMARAIAGEDTVRVCASACRCLTYQQQHSHCV